MDDRMRKLEREWNESGNPEVGAALRTAHKRMARFSAGDYVRLDASLVEDAEPHLVGNFAIFTARTEVVGRTYTIVRLGAATVEDEQGRPTHAEDDTATLSESALGALLVTGDTPLERDGIAVPVLPVPLHYQVSVRTRSTALDSVVSAKPRLRRTRKPEITVPIASVNTALGIFLRPKMIPAPEVVVEASVVEPAPVVEDEVEDTGSVLASEVQAGLTKARRRRRRGRRAVPELGHPESECGCACHLPVKDIPEDALCGCLVSGAACDAGRLA